MELARNQMIDPAVAAMAARQAPRPAGVQTADPSEVDNAPVVLSPAELRQLWLEYRDLLDLHRAEVVNDEDFEDAHRLLVEQVLPLRSILHEQEHLVVTPDVDLTY